MYIFHTKMLCVYFFTKIFYQVKVLYVRNLTQEVTENRLKETFEAYGSVERVKKIKDYAFIHFNDRSCALKVM